MSEEKEAIKYLEFLINEKKCECDICQRAKKEYKTILNLIDKQQKVIKELKEEQSKRNWIYIKKNREVLPLLYISKGIIREKIKNISIKAFKNEINYSEYYYKTEILNELLEGK